MKAGAPKRTRARHVAGRPRGGGAKTSREATPETRATRRRHDVMAAVTRLSS